MKTNKERIVSLAELQFPYDPSCGCTHEASKAAYVMNKEFQMKGMNDAEIEAFISKLEEAFK